LAFREGSAEPTQIMQRAQKVAIGSVDTGLSQAEEMLRRVSPEGRAQARRERLARAGRRNQLLARLALVALASLGVLIVLAQMVSPAISISAAAAVMVLLTILVLSRAGTLKHGREALSDAPLKTLPSDASAWLAAQRRALPAPAVRLADGLERRLDELAPQLARLDPVEPAANAVKKLVATELPALIEGWRAVPASLRSAPQANGRSPDEQLVDGFALIDEELARMTEQLSRGALDEVATQGRYLELKYGGEAGLRG
jgi:hypothetical protein